jgi:hypothetical protein
MLSTLSVRREKLCVKFATKKLCQEWTYSWTISPQSDWGEQKKKSTM